MNKQEWTTRCAARYIERAGLSREDAAAAAEVCWQECQCDPDAYSTETPEDMADGDMDCWDDDDAPEE